MLLHKSILLIDKGYFRIIIRITIVSILRFLYLLFLGFVDAGELRLNPNITQTIQHAGPDRSFFISCLPFSYQAQGISDSRVRASELSWKKLRRVPIDEWVVMGSASNQR